MAYEADVSIIVRHPTNGNAETLYERTGVNEWRRFKRQSSAQRWSNWPSEGKPITEAEAVGQIAIGMTKGRVA